MTGEPFPAGHEPLPDDQAFQTDIPGVRAPTPRLKRTVTLLMLGRLNRRGRDTICRIRNVSEGGVRIDTGSPLEEGEQVALEVRNGVCIEGRVAWTSHRSAGIAFARNVDLPELLEAPMGPSGKRAATRSPRFRASAIAQLQVDGRLVNTLVVDISLGGCRVESNASFPRQADGSLTIPGLMPLMCTKRWTTGNRSGLSFLTRPDFVDFAQWLENTDNRFADASYATSEAGNQHPVAARFDAPRIVPVNRSQSC